MARTERHIGLGWTAEGFRVVATLALTSEAGISQFTDHTQGPTPERVSVMFDVSDSRSGYFRGGQVDTEDRVIARRAVKGVNGYNYSDADEETAAFIDRVWREHHLNDMQAACDHMTPEMLNPDAETLAAFKTAKIEKTGVSYYSEADALQSWRLDTVVCPETGYRWGHAWLARSVPADVLDRVRSLIA